MKTIPLVFVAILATAATVRSQEAEAADSRESTTTPATPITTPQILGNIPDGTPPPPEPPKPEFKVAQGDILTTTTHEQGGRTITIQRIKPIALPPPPAPPPVSKMSDADEAAFRERLAEYREEHPRSGMLFLGATVFRSKDSPPRTLVRYWPEGKGGGITFWSSADFALIAGGIQSFVDSAQDTHCMLMGWGNVDIDRMTDLRAAKGLEYDAPHMPEFPGGKATFQIVGQQPLSEDLVTIQSLHDLYNSEFERLKAAYEGRERARIEHEAYLKAHPPQPKNITLSFWRTDNPAPSNGGDQ